MTPTPQKAGLFHTGNTCPFCQETIEEAQVIIICNNCGSIHHESCWCRKGKCSSYHCDDSVHTDAAQARPDIRIDAQELEHVRVPPKPVRQAPEAVARQYALPKPERVSRMAIATVVTGAIALCGIGGAVLHLSYLVVLGLSFALLTIVLGVIAIVMTSGNRRLSGAGLSIIGILASVGMVFLYFSVLGRTYSHSRIQAQTDLKISESLPKEEYLARIPQPIARALRANVVIRYNEGFIGEHSYGSGIILGVKNRRAYILTNKHVIGNGRPGEISVTIFTGETSTAELTWSAPEGADVALLSCQALTLEKFEPAPLAEDLASHGDKVFAVGNPMELSWSYAEGTISGQRTSHLGGLALDVYQTQTPLNPGNSGGGLYALDGRLIGLNTWTHDKATGEGLGFATATTSILKLMREAKITDLIAPAEVPAEAPPPEQQPVGTPTGQTGDPPAEPAGTAPAGTPEESHP